MALYVGEAVTIKATATDPLRNTVISDATAVCDFYAPGKDPKGVPADRTVDKPQITLTFDAALGVYLGYANTAGWVPGKWSFKVTLSGSYQSWEFGTFTLKA